MIFIIKGFRTIVFIFIVISITFRPICPSAFFRCLSNSGTFTELRTTSFMESTEVTCSDSVSHNRVQVLSIPVLLLACSQASNNKKKKKKKKKRWIYSYISATMFDKHLLMLQPYDSSWAKPSITQVSFIKNNIIILIGLCYVCSNLVTK